MRNDEQHRLECEVREWKRLIKKNGRAWWDNVKKPELLKARGQAGLDYLLEAMNRKDNDR